MVQASQIFYAFREGQGSTMDETAKFASGPSVAPDEKAPIASSASSCASASLDLQERIGVSVHLASGDSSQASRFVAECRPISKEEWDAILPEFRDANLYQTWTYAAVRWGEMNLSHLVLKDGPIPVGAAQLILVKLPVTRRRLGVCKVGAAVDSAGQRCRSPHLSGAFAGAPAEIRGGTGIPAAGDSLGV